MVAREHIANVLRLGVGVRGSMPTMSVRQCRYAPQRVSHLPYTETSIGDPPCSCDCLALLLAGARTLGEDKADGVVDLPRFLCMTSVEGLSASLTAGSGLSEVREER